MSDHALRTFVPALQDLERELALPIPERVRILRELEYDLEELWNRFHAQGLSEEEARRRALDALLPDALTLHALGRLHAPWYRKITRGITEDRLQRWEKNALAVAVALVVGSQVLALSTVDFFADPSPFLWPVLGLGSLLFAAVLAKAFQLWIKGDHQAPETGLGAILALACVTLATGVAGAATGLYRLAATLEAAPELMGSLAPVWLVRDTTLLAVALVLALLGGLAWFVLNQWVAGIRAARREALGLPTALPS